MANMTTTVALATQPAPLQKKRGFVGKLLRDRSGLIAGVVALGMLFLAFVGPLLFPVDLNALGVGSFLPPSPEHVLGTDEYGRDLLLLVINGATASMTIGISVAVAVTVLGVLIGGVAGYAGGVVDSVVMRVTELFQVMPAFVLAAVAVAVLGSNTTSVIIILAILGWPQIARIVRGEVLRLKRLEFVDALLCLGQPTWKILLREVLPNAMAPAITLGTLVVGQAILLEAGLGFLGIGATGAGSWGGLLNRGQEFLTSAWWMSVFPGLAIAVTVVSINIFGDAVGRILNPSKGK
jgi:peptide/nickel transport system permease protein